MAKKLSRAQVTKLARNPGTRSKIPTSQLPAKYRKMRSANQAASARSKALDDPNALTAPLTPRLLDQQVNSAADLYAGGAERELQGQQAQAATVSQSIPAWFQDYQAALQHATTAAGASYAAAAQGQQNAVNSSSALDAQQSAVMQSKLQADAQLRGTTVDPSIAATAQQASSARRATGDIQTGLTLGLGATQTAYRAGQQVVGAGQQLRAQMNAKQQERNLGVKAQQLATDKGNYAATQRQKLIDAEHTKQLENKAFGLNEQKAANDVAISTAELGQKAKIANQTSTDRRLALQTRMSVADADRASREREGHLTRLTRKATANTIATSGVTPAEKRRRNTAVDTMERQRTSAVNYATSTAKLLKGATPIKDPATGKAFPTSFSLRRALEKKYPTAPKEVIDYAMAAALGSKAGVTKKGQATAAQRYRSRLKRLADGTLAK